MPISDKQWAAAEAQGAAGPVAIGARYDAERQLVLIDFADGCFFGIPAARLEGLDEAPAAVRANLVIEAGGTGLQWPDLDLDLSIPALLQGLTGTRAFMARQLGMAGGQSRSAAKSASARTNGRKGGRPRKSQPA